jgi:energy-coupling factor transporter ATP-binding protein EcfA2
MYHQYFAQKLTIVPYICAIKIHSMDNLRVKSLGPIKEANVSFGDLTLLVGPQASGKSIFIQILKLIIDKKHIRKTLEQYNFVWSKNPDEVLDRYFGEGMRGIWNSDTDIQFDDKVIDKKYLEPKPKDLKETDETLFYIPAQRILSIDEGRPKNFMEFESSSPYVLRHFTETLRRFLQNDLSPQDVIFPKKQGLKHDLKTSFNESIFHDGVVVIDDKSGVKKLKMNIGGMSLPFMTWSAGQKEFMPLLLSFYWLCPPSKISQRDQIKYVVIEEPEMGLHPQAIKSVLLQVMDLMERGYKVIISTHSPVLLEFAWAVKYLQQNKANYKSLAELFDMKISGPVRKIFSSILEQKTINTYYFERKDITVSVKDISSLDAGNDDLAIAEWGGLSSFSSKASDIISNLVAAND